MTAFLALIDALPVTTDAAPPERGRREILDLGRREGLTTDDAAYPELAERRRLPLATRDQALRQAAGRVGVAALP